MAESVMRRVKLPIEVVAMVLSELTHAEAWRLRILNSAVNDWVLNVLVKRALQATALVARAPGSFIFYEPPGGVHGLRFSFLQKHGAHAIFQAKASPDDREVQEFKKKTHLQIVVHIDNNRDPLIIRHLKLRDLSLDRDSVTLQCNWRTLFISAFNMNPQQRSDQALATSPLYVWLPAKIDGMPGRWKKGVTWLYSDSQASTVSQRSTSTASSSQHLYGLVAYDSGSGTTTSSSSQSHHTHVSHHSNITHVTNNTTSSGFSSSQLSQIGDVPQSSPPRHLGMMVSHTNMLHSLSVYPDSSASSDPSRPPDVADGGSGSSVLKTLGLDGNNLNPAPPILDPQPEPGSSGGIPASHFASAFVRDRFTPAPAEDRDARGSEVAVASSPMSDSLAFSATIRPGLRGGGSSPLAGVVEEEEEGDGDMSWMYGSERDVSCMLDLAQEETRLDLGDEDEDKGGNADGQAEVGLARTESLGTGTTLAGTGSVGALSRMGSGMTESTDVEVFGPGSLNEKEEALEGKLSNEAMAVIAERERPLGGTASLPLGPRPRTEVGDMGRVMSLSPQVARRTRSAEPGSVGPTSSVDFPPSDAEEF